MTFKPLVFIGLFLCLVGLQPLLAQVNAFDRPGTVNSDLQLTKTADKSIARVGSIVNFTVKVKNLGPNKSEGSTVFDLLPNGFTFISSSLPAEYNSISGEWDVPEIEVGAEATLVITASVNPITPTSIYTNVVQIFDVKNTDPNPANNRAEFTVIPFDFKTEVNGEFTGVGGAICANSRAIVRATSTNIIEPIYKWYADAQLANLLHIGANYTTPALSFTTTYYLVVTGTNIPTPTAADAKQVTVSVLEVPTAPVAIVRHPTCEISTGSITVSSPLAPGYLYSLDGATYLNNSGVFTGIAPGSYAVSVKNANGCIGANSIVVVNPKPEGLAAPSLDIQHPTCDLGTGTITISSPKNPGNTYSINGVDYSNTTGVFTQVTAGTYTVTVKNASGCISSGTSAVVNANPLTPQTPVVASTNPLCPAKTGTITVSSPVGNGFTYSIDGASYFNSTGVFTSVLPGAYNVSVKNASGCVSPSVLVTIKDPVVDEPKLTISANGSTTICQGSSVVLTSSESVSYQWYKYGVAIAGANGKTYTASTEGIYSVSRVYNIPGCSGIQSDGIDVKLSVLPVAPVVVVAQPSCEISTGTITVTSPIAVGNTYSINGVDYSNTTGVFTQVSAGTYTVTVKNVSGCISSGTLAVVNLNPLTPQKPVVASTNPLCPAKTGTITITTPVGTGFTYSIDGGSYLNNGGVFTSVLPGTYIVSVKNASGCVSPSVLVTIKDPIVDEPKLTITSSASTSICVGSSVVLTSSDAPSYQWYKYGVAIAGANAKTFTASTEGVYTVSRFNNNGCIAIQSDGVEVKMVANPLAPLVNADKMLFCDGDSVVLNGTAAFGLQWFKDGIAITGATNNKLVIKQGGTYAALAINDNGCRSPFSEALVIKMVDLPVTPVLTIQGTAKFCKDETRLLQVNVPTGLIINWYKNGNLISAYTKDTLRVKEAAEYTVKFVNSNGCFSLVSNKIITEIGCNTTGIYIPDVFSPNGDGINENIKPVCVGISMFKFFKVYNRWGNILFETTDEGKGWDGKFRGQVQPADSYIWLVEGVDTNGKEIRKTGVLNLIK
jgi:uncharacterized repeat protein (TIGR01451 family)/gliding motility-associated-like protein